MAMSIGFAVLVIGFGAGTVLFGWWTVPVVGLIWGGITRSRLKSGAYAALGAALAWSLLLLWTATQGHVMTLAGRVGAVFGIPAGVFVALPPLLAALLGGSAALVAGSLTPPKQKK